MTDEERRILIHYHASLIAKWVKEGSLASVELLAFHAERTLGLIKELDKE